MARAKKTTPDSGTEKFNELIRLAELDLWNEFERARLFNQQGDVGTARESAVGRFLIDQLPGRYRVAAGEVVDRNGNSTGQTDLMIYDGTLTRPLYVRDSSVLLPAEALLAAVEVKTTLTAQEVDKCTKSAQLIHGLRPWGEPWIPPRQEGEDAADRQPRVLFSIFAYQSDLTAEEWAVKELRRLRERAADRSCPVEHIDRLVVLDKGMLLPARGAVATPSELGVLRLWFFSLINFLAREVERRRPFPWDRYSPRKNKEWTQIADPQLDAPRVPATPAAKSSRKARQVPTKKAKATSERKARRAGPRSRRAPKRNRPAS